MTGVGTFFYTTKNSLSISTPKVDHTLIRELPYDTKNSEYNDSENDQEECDKDELENGRDTNADEKND